MARKFTIKETDIIRMIIEEFNDNAFSEKITFSIADWAAFGTDESGNPKSLLINRMALNKQGRFDVKESFNENTYVKKEQSFVAMNIGSLNGEFVALNTIKDVTYDFIIEFLVAIDNIYVQQAITLAIEEIRARFIQYERKLEVEYPNIEDITSKTKTSETLKVIMTSGSIDYGFLGQISGHQYLTYSLPVTMQVTNFGEFANQQKIYLGVDSILDGSDPKMFLLEPNEWHYGRVDGVESAQVLPSKSDSTYKNSKEIKSVVKSKGFSFNMELQIDLLNEDVGPILKHFYKRSLKETLTVDTYTLKIETYLFYPDTKEFESSDSTYWEEQIEDNRDTVVGSISDISASDYEEGYAIRVTSGSLPLTYSYYKVKIVEGTYRIDNDLTMEREMICTYNQPPESLSKGEKIVNSIVLIPKYKIE